jgi:hypothetical protein
MAMDSFEVLGSEGLYASSPSLSTIKFRSHTTRLKP